MRKIAVIIAGLVLFCCGEAAAQGCAAIYAKKMITRTADEITQTQDFSAEEINNGIQMQCGQEYYICAETFAPGGSSDYVFESIPYNPPYPFNSGTEYVLPRDDCWGLQMSLGYNRPPEPAGTPEFKFSFYGQDYNYCVIGSNALLSFDISVQSLNPTTCESTCAYSQGSASGTIPNPARYKNAIYGPYHDTHFGGSSSYPGHMYFQILGEYPCRQIVLSFYEVPLFPSQTDKLATHMMVLYETTNVIEFYMQNKPCCTSTNGGKATLGIHNQDGTQALTITNDAGQSYNTTQWTAQNEAWRIKPSGQLDYYGVEWYKRGATDYAAELVQVVPDAMGVIHVDVQASEGAQKYFCKNIIARTDGEEFEVWDSTAAYYPIDMPDLVVVAPDTVCRGEVVNFEVSGAGASGKYYMTEPFTDPADTLAENLTGNFQRANNAAADEVTYTFKVENYDQYGTLVCTRYISHSVVNRSFEVELTEDFVICKGDEVSLADLKEPAHSGVCTWSTGFTGDELVFSPEQTVNVTLTKTDNLGCTATDECLITVNEAPELTITGTLAICRGTGTTLRANVTPANCLLEWSNGSTENTITVTPDATEEYTVSAKLPPAMCEQTASATVEVYEIPTVMASQDRTICEGKSAQISVNGNATRWVWETTDGAANGSNATELTVQPQQTTRYTIHGYNDINCHASDDVLITVEALPTPIILLNPSVLDALDPTVIITDASTGNVSREWTLSDGTTSTDERFVHTFELEDTTMRFDISLVATSNAGCVDSTSTYIRVKRDHYLWAPTGIYMHDNNPANRQFRLWIDNIVEYDLMIFNRNGEMIFRTDKIDDAWDCTYKGEPVQQGVYVWKVLYRHNDAPNKQESRTGNFMIYN